MHITETLKLLHDALKQFYDNKDIFVDLGIYNDFYILKLHFLDHYIMYIELYGMVDNCNTEYTECLHIDLTKDTWDATNGKDMFPQMIIWLKCHKKISCHAKFISWQTGQWLNPPDQQNPGILYCYQPQMTKLPSKKTFTFTALLTTTEPPTFRMHLLDSL